MMNTRAQLKEQILANWKKLLEQAKAAGIVELEKFAQEQIDAAEGSKATSGR